MKSKKYTRVLSVIMSLLAIIGVLSYNSENVQADMHEPSGLLYTVSGGHATITGFITPSEFNGDVVIPSSLGRAGVRSIANDAFEDCSQINSITIPSSVTSIGESAFSYCRNLSAINVDTANATYKSIDGVLYSKTGTALIRCPEAKSGSYIIPSVVTSIGDCAFENCTGLASISIPSSVTSIGNSAFFNCQVLQSVTIPNSVTMIGNYAFAFCYSLDSISIPNRVTSIGASAFRYCYSLRNAYFYGNAPTMGHDVFSGVPSNFTVYYLPTKAGYTNPWRGYPTVTFVDPVVSYQSCVQDIGWQDYVSNGEVSGTYGQSKRIEAIRINLEGIAGGIEYRTHVQDIGWQYWVSNDLLSGTVDQSKRLEAIQIRLTGAAEDTYDVYYRVHVENTGWMGWAKNGESSGTAGYAYRVEAIEIQMVAKGGAAPGSTACAFIVNSSPDVMPNPIPMPTPIDPGTNSVTYKTHVQDIGWQNYVSNGSMSGTSGQSKRLEGIQINLQNIAGGIEYSTHVQDIGWMGFVANGAMSGTSGQSKRLEAIKIRLTGAAVDAYDIYYCVHAQNTGWLDWAKNGAEAGTAGLSYRLEAIKIVIVPKGGPAPGPTGRPFVQG